MSEAATVEKTTDTTEATVNPFGLDDEQLEKAEQLRLAAGVTTENLTEWMNQLAAGLNTTVEGVKQTRSGNMTVAYYRAAIQYGEVDEAGWPLMSLLSGNPAEVKIQTLLNDALSIPTKDELKGQGMNETQAVEEIARLKKERAATYSAIRTDQSRAFSDAFLSHFVFRNLQAFGVSPEDIERIQGPGAVIWEPAHKDFPTHPVTGQALCGFQAPVDPVIVKCMQVLYSTQSAKDGKVKLPVKYGGDKKLGGGNESGTKDKKSTPEQLAKVIDDLVPTLNPRTGTTVLIGAVKGYIRSILPHRGEMEDRQTIGNEIEEMAAHLLLTAKFVRKHSDAADYKALEDYSALPKAADLNEIIEKAVAETQAKQPPQTQTRGKKAQPTEAATAK